MPKQIIFLVGVLLQIFTANFVTKIYFDKIAYTNDHQSLARATKF